MVLLFENAVIQLALTCRAGTIIEAPNPDVDRSAFDGVRWLVRPYTTQKRDLTWITCFNTAPLMLISPRLFVSTR